MQKIILVAIMVAVLTNGCGLLPRYDTRFRAGDEALCSMAVNALLGTRGFTGGEVPRPADVKIIEEDSYGRKLFIYYEGRRYNLLVSQKIEGEHVYFYPD